MIEEEDPNGERSSKVRRGIEKELACYKVLYEEKKKAAVQLKLDKFFTKQPIGYCTFYVSMSSVSSTD
jgi:hypothetical protein